MSETYFLDLQPDRMEGEVAVVFFFEDDRPLHGAAALLDWRLNGKLTELLLAGSATGRSGDIVAVRNNGKLDVDWALFLGGGNREKLTAAAWEKLLKKGFKVCEKAGFDRVAFCLDSQEEVPAAELKQLVVALRDNGSSLESLFSFDTVPVLTRSRSGKQESLL
ncbi:MAG: hypothetical protein C0615_06950 [Desulfuromonas sp.]|nr:MAG: hypothetical protein C0615_06950 [Desulfuromonas sp.]